MNDNVHPRFPNLSKVVISILESKIEPIIGKDTIAELKAPLLKKELAHKVNLAIQTAEDRFINQYADDDVISALQELSIADLPSTQKIISDYFLTPDDSSSISQIVSHFEAILPPEFSNEALILAAKVYFRYAIEEISIIPEFGEKLKTLATLRTESNTSEIKDILSSINKKLDSPKLFASTTLKLEPRFLVPFPRNKQFQGREEEISQLYTNLSPTENLGAGPLMVYGMGGVGKTQLLIEYVYRYKNEYPGGIYWINGAQDWLEELSKCAIAIGVSIINAAVQERLFSLAVSFGEYLNTHPYSLLIIDNVDDPRVLFTQISGFVPAELKCKLVITTRRNDSNPHYKKIELQVFSEEIAVNFMRQLENPKYERTSASSDFVIKSICREFGYLPLALAVALAYLCNFPEISLDEYFQRLIKEGGLISTEGTDLDKLDLPTNHDISLSATLRIQWEAVKNPVSRLALQILALLGKGVQIPLGRLSLFSGISDLAPTGYPTLLTKTIKELSRFCLLEEMTNKGVRLHPLIQEFIISTIDDKEKLINQVIDNLTQSIYDPKILDFHIKKRGIDDILMDIKSGQVLSQSNRDSNLFLLKYYQMLERESHFFRNWEKDKYPYFFLQQWRNICFEYDETDIQMKIEDYLSSIKAPYLRKLNRQGVRDKANLRKMIGHKNSVLKIAIAKEKDWVISASRDTRIRVWDIKSGLCIKKLSGHNDWVIDITLTSDDKFLISCSLDKTIRIWDLDTGICIRTFSEYGRINCIALLPDDTHCILGLGNNDIIIIDINTGKTEHCLKGHSGEINTLAVSYDGKTIFSGSLDCTIRVWDVKTQSCLAVFSGHEDIINDVEISKDDRFVFSASNDKTIRLWEIKTGKIIKIFQGHSH